jgi:hydroxymethylbilane synthase
VEDIVPAVGQGALAVETRAGEDWIAAQVREAVNDIETELCVLTERAALRAMMAGCSAPLGIYAERADARCSVRGIADGETTARAARSASVANALEAEALGEALAAALRADEKRDDSSRRAEGLSSS